MACVRFKEHLLVDGNRDVTIERMFYALGQYSGLLDYSFDAHLSDNFELWPPGRGIQPYAPFLYMSPYTVGYDLATFPGDAKLCTGNHPSGPTYYLFWDNGSGEVNTGITFTTTAFGGATITLPSPYAYFTPTEWGTYTGTFRSKTKVGQYYVEVASLSITLYYNMRVPDFVWDLEHATGQWGASAGTLTGKGPGGATWGFLQAVPELPESFVLNATKKSDRGAIAFLMSDAQTHCKLVWDATSVSFVRAIGGAETVLCSIPKVMAGTSAIELSVQRGESGYFMSAWFDGELAANAYSATLLNGRGVALCAYGSDTATFGPIRVAELTEALPIVTMDVGEQPIGALQRGLGRRHVNYFARFDGTLRAWRPKAQWLVLALTESEINSHHEEKEARALLTHWRQVGAWHEADAWNTLYPVLGHRFHKDDNPDLMTLGDVQREAEYNLARIEEYAHTIQFEAPFCVLLEPEDRIELYDQNWILTSYNLSKAAGRLAMTAQARVYTYGEPSLE